MLGYGHTESQEYQHCHNNLLSLQNDSPPCISHVNEMYIYHATLIVPSYCISDQLSACSKNYKAKGSICVSIFDQWLLWSGSRPAVQT